MSNTSLDEYREAYRSARMHRNSSALRDVSRQLDQIDDPTYQTLKLQVAASLAMMSGELAEATELLLKLKSTAEAGEDRLLLARVIGDIGIVHWESGEYTESLEHFHHALAIYEELKDIEGIGAVTNNIGLIFNFTGDYPASLEYYHKALAMHQQAGNQQNVANTTGNIAGILADTGDRTAALEYFLRAFDLHQQLNNQGSAASQAMAVASSLIDLDRLTEAEEWVERATDMIQDSSDLFAVSQFAVGLIEARMRQQRYDDVRRVIDRHWSSIERYPGAITSTLSARAKIHIEEGAVDKAKELFEEVLSQATERNERKLMATTHKELRDIAKDAGDFEAYVSHNEAFQTITEEVSGADSARRMAMQEKEREIEEERKQREKEREILYGALPQHVADRLVHGEDVTDNFESASVMFLDIAGFTRIASTIPPGHVVHLLESIFSVCDEIVQKHGLTKVKTIGDSYMAVAGVPDLQDDHVDRMARASTEIQEALTRLQLKMPPELGDTSWVDNIKEVHARVGVHCGPVVAGVVGKERLQYDVWGDAVNVASRMESSGEPGRVQASQNFIDALGDRSAWEVEPRIAFEIKGKGMMQTYWIEAI